MIDLTCRWRGADKARVLPGRHDDQCANNDTCRGCQPCTENHCVVCRDEHAEERTCPTCVGKTREDINEIRDLYRTLPGHVVFAGNDSHLEAGRPIPGGEAMVMLAPASDARAAVRAQYAGRDATHRQDEDQREPMMPELALDTWEADWRKTRGSRTSLVVSVSASARYLLDHLSWAAQNHDAFPAFATEMHTQRARIEDVLHAGERPQLGAPCESCGNPLERVWASAAVSDRWWCDRCKQAFRLGEYVENVARAARKHKDWLTSRDMEAEHSISRGSLTGWASKGLVRKRKDINLGRMVYSVEDALTRRDTGDTGESGDSVA